MYAVEVEAGRMEPIPDYVSDWQLARWMGVTVPEMLEMPLQHVEQARVVMHAMNDAQHQTQTRASRR